MDDEALARTALVRLLKRERDVSLIGQCGDGESAVQAIRQSQPDIVFLDVQMPEMDGFQVVEAIGVEQMPVTIFVTAFDRYAIRAFDANAVDYLLKPFAADRLARALARARDRCLGRQDKEAAQRLFSLLDGRLQSDYAQRLTVATGGRIVFVPVADIDWIEAEGNYARLHVSRKILRRARDAAGVDGEARSAGVHSHSPIDDCECAADSRSATVVSREPHRGVAKRRRAAHVALPARCGGAAVGEAGVERYSR